MFTWLGVRLCLLAVAVGVRGYNFLQCPCLCVLLPLGFPGDSFLNESESCSFFHCLPTSPGSRDSFCPRASASPNCDSLHLFVSLIWGVLIFPSNFKSLIDLRRVVDFQFSFFSCCEGRTYDFQAPYVLG